MYNIACRSVNTPNCEKIMTSHFILRPSHFIFRASHFILRASHFILRASYFIIGNYALTIIPSHFSVGNYQLTIMPSHFILGNYQITIMPSHFSVDNYQLTIMQSRRLIMATFRKYVSTLLMNQTHCVAMICKHIGQGRSANNTCPKSLHFI